MKLELAWAAGFFDAEGGFSYANAGGGRRRAQASVSQGGDAYPETLERFSSAVGGLGCKLRVPARGYLYYWYSHRLDHVQAVGTMLWPWLGDEKRAEFEDVMRRTGRASVPLETVPGGTPPMEEIAWAAGLFDGEGTVTASRTKRTRVIEACLPQSGSFGVPAALGRFQRVVARGRIYERRKRSDPWSKLPQYRWRSTNLRDVQGTLRLIWPWLSTQKRAQAIAALELYGAPTVHPREGAEPVAQN